LGEAAGVLLGALELLRNPIVQLALGSLDAFCGGMVSAWRPPWVEQGVDRLDLPVLSATPQAVVFAWAKNLEGFISFLKTAAVAVKAGRVINPVVPGAEVIKEEEEEESQQAAATAEERPEAQSRPIREAEDGLGVPQPGEASLAATLVAVLPDRATAWQVEVLGSLGIATGVYLVYERAWHADFGSAAAVPFSVKQMSAPACASSGHLPATPAACEAAVVAASAEPEGPEATSPEQAVPTGVDANETWGGGSSSSIAGLASPAPAAACGKSAAPDCSADASAIAASASGRSDASVPLEGGASGTGGPCEDSAHASASSAASGAQVASTGDAVRRPQGSWGRLGLAEEALQLSREATAGLIAELQGAPDAGS